VKATEIVFGEEPGTYERQLVQRLQQRVYYYYLNDDDDTTSVEECKSVVGYTGFANEAIR
jgi:hypothetical protein